jgi:hypothetical protein
MSPGIPSKPFKDTHGEQIALVRNFDWLDLSALDGIADEFRELLFDSDYIEDVRREMLCSALESRVRLLETMIGEGSGDLWRD